MREPASVLSSPSSVCRFGTGRTSPRLRDCLERERKPTWPIRCSLWPTSPAYAVGCMKVASGPVLPRRTRASRSSSDGIRRVEHVEHLGDRLDARRCRTAERAADAHVDLRERRAPAAVDRLAGPRLLERRRRRWRSARYSDTRSACDRCSRRRAFRSTPSSVVTGSAERYERIDADAEVVWQLHDRARRDTVTRVGPRRRTVLEVAERVVDVLQQVLRQLVVRRTDSRSSPSPACTRHSGRSRPTTPAAGRR